MNPGQKVTDKGKIWPLEWQSLGESNPSFQVENLTS